MTTGVNHGNTQELSITTLRARLDQIHAWIKYSGTENNEDRLQTITILAEKLHDEINKWIDVELSK